MQNLQSHQDHFQHRVLGISELLSFILSHATPRTQVAAALVCKAWLDPALDGLWRELNWPGYAFQLLAPLERNDSLGSLCFTRQVLAKDWPRFEFYAKRVRFLRYVEDTKRGNFRLFRPTIFEEIFRTRPKSDIWPNLKHLDLSLLNLGLSPCVLVLFGKGIQSLNIKLPLSSFIDGIGDAHVEFFKELLKHSPAIKELTLDLTNSTSEAESRIINYLSSAPSLRKLTMPERSLSSNVMTAIAKLPELHTIAIAPAFHQSAHPSPITTFQPSLQEGAFPALKVFSFDGTLKHASHFFARNFAPVNLTHLSLFPGESTPETFSSCLETLAVSCQSLVFLEFQLKRGDWNASNPQISYEMLATLRGLRNLMEFTLSDTYPVSLTDEELEDLVSSWPSLKSFHLPVYPRRGMDTSNLTLACLFALTQHCPDLVELRLYMDTTIHVPPLTTSQTMMKLKELNVGVSPIDDVHAVSMFLGKLCPVDCRVYGMKSFFRGVSPQELRPRIEHYETLWGRVTDCLPLVLELESREQERLRALNAELLVLRSKVKALEDQLRLEERRSRFVMTSDEIL